MVDTSKFHRGDIVYHRLTWRRYRVVSVDVSRVLVVPAECPVLFNPAWAFRSFWLDVRLLGVV